MTSASITIRRKTRPGVTVLSIPMLVLWVFVVPIAILLFPLIALACLVAGIDPFDLYAAIWRIARALSGTEFEVAYADRSVQIRIVEESLL